ncbi:hypothetical protein [Asticcacaulis tiandongensis]|uniref:hypothetical protein n=1 Tax=Asticcacaulis tiandongensis TaxID=2565365 RepID=UPI0011279DB1|nr:hypothetical protein [Asticcacaulis tiandongensis]
MHSKQILIGLGLAFALFATSPVAANDSPPVKKSNSGICHARGTTYYAQTKHFTPYATLDACLKSGGRLPKR